MELGHDALGEGFASLLGMQITDMPFADQFVGGKSPDVDGHVTDMDKNALGIRLPGEGPTVTREIFVAVHAGGQRAGTLFYQPLQIFVAVVNDIAQQGQDRRDGQPAQQNKPPRIEDLLMEKFRRGGCHDGIGSAESQDGQNPAF